MAPRVSALLGGPRGRVEVELDGEPWRALPAEVVLAAGVDVGVELDRPRARRLRQELRRHEAMTKAARAIGRRDLSARELANRLQRAQVAPAVREEAVVRLIEAGAVDDERLARRRAELLSERGAGNALISHDLIGRGIAAAVAEGALASLEPESLRAARIVQARGQSLTTLRYLARKGFSEDAIETACAAAVAESATRAVR